MGNIQLSFSGKRKHAENFLEIGKNYRQKGLVSKISDFGNKLKVDLVMVKSDMGQVLRE